MLSWDMRHLFSLLSFALLACLVSGDSFAGEARAEASPKAAHQLRIATLAPRQSGLGKAFQQLRRDLKERTDGQVELKMYDGGVAGDEMTVVRKMRVGQLDGALLTSTGLGALVPQVLVLQAPGLIGSYPELDDVREKLGPDLETQFDKAGYELISWGDSGQIRIFSKHKIQHPSDLKGVRPWVWRGSPTMKAFIEAAGANGVTMGLPEVYSALQTGMVDTVISSSIGVLAFQWHTRLKTMTKPGGGIVVGAYVIKKDRLAALPKAAQDYIRQSAKDHAQEFRDGGRRLDKEASDALAGRLKTINLFRNQQAWAAVQREAREALAGRLYSRSLLTRVEEIVGKDY
jgi:TRAP-type C4-dicarboxylate transport system substrate-binding protein